MLALFLILFLFTFYANNRTNNKINCTSILFASFRMHSLHILQFILCFASSETSWLIFCLFFLLFFNNKFCSFFFLLILLFIFFLLCDFFFFSHIESCMFMSQNCSWFFNERCRAAPQKKCTVQVATKALLATANEIIWHAMLQDSLFFSHLIICCIKTFFFFSTLFFKRCFVELMWCKASCYDKCSIEMNKKWF